MKTIFTITCCALTVHLAAQAIDADWQLQPGQARQSIPIFNTGFTFTGEAGTDQVWDFSFVSDGAAEARSFVAREELSFLDTFPETTLGQVFNTGSENYFVQNDTTLELIGFVNSGSTFIDFPDPRRLMQFPLTYGASFADTFTNVVVNSTGDTLQQNAFEATTTFLGIGRLILPNDAIFDDVYLVRTISGFLDGESNEILYIWYKDALANKLLELNVNLVTGTVGFGEWQRNLNPVSTTEPSQTFIKDDLVQLGDDVMVTNVSGKAGSLRAYDLNGFLLWEQPVPAARNTYYLPLREFPRSGLYVLCYCADDGVPLATLRVYR